MPRSTTTITIFLASPGDVLPERELVASTVDKWNRIRGRETAVHFDLLRWETNVSAGFSTDGQKVINDQIGLDYDVLIALFWARIGTATPRSESGTTEEYERALSRFREGEAIDIAFFFKDAPVPIGDIDPSQIQGVNDLRSQVSADGALYKLFKDEDGLRFEVDLLLDRIARRYSGGEHGGGMELTVPTPRMTTAVISNDATVSAVHPTEEGALIQDERGLLDISDDLERHSVAAGKFLDEMTRHLNDLSATTNTVTKSLQEKARLGPVDPSETRPLVTQVSHSMDMFSDFLEKNTPDFSENSQALSADLRALIDVSHDFSRSDQDIDQFEKTVEDLIQSMDFSIENLIGLLNETNALQRMTSAFNHAKKRLARNLSILITSLTSSRSIIGEAATEIQSLRP